MIHFDLVWQVLISFDHLQTKHIWTCFNLVHPCSPILTCLDLFCPVLNHVNFILTCFEPFLTNFNRFRPVLIRFDLSHRYWPILSVSTLWNCFDPFWPGFHLYSPGFTRLNVPSPVFTYFHIFPHVCIGFQLFFYLKLMIISAQVNIFSVSCTRDFSTSNPLNGTIE